MIASGLSLGIIPSFGWRALFYTGLIPLAVVPALLSTPESIRYLERRGRRAEAMKILRLFGVEEVGEVEGGEEEEEKAKLSDLFSRDYRGRTILLWTLWFVLVYTYHGIFLSLIHI